ncbi:MAG: hypothetical protein LBV54_04345 [Puniceicoccales bacterium]|jgi:phosphopantothenoylcysteine decarboxylase/phosphopantothenate--cysteine ligase|nr:hypothetical protein [Puniceicoccales bacterium]
MPLRCLITAGPTREFFDPVRFISNPSSGKMGYALAVAALEAGCVVDLVSGPVALSAPAGAILHPVVTGAEMLAQVEALFSGCDILIKTAAVCDFRPKHYSSGKVKKEAVPLSVEFEPVPDILKIMAARKRTGQTVVGFAAETDDIENYARRKLVEKKLDLIVANRVGRDGGLNAFGADVNRVILLGRDGGRRELGPAGKLEIARGLVAAILEWHAARA